MVPRQPMALHLECPDLPLLVFGMQADDLADGVDLLRT
jgi:hypothetical protein